MVGLNKTLICLKKILETEQNESFWAKILVYW